MLDPLLATGRRPASDGWSRRNTAGLQKVAALGRPRAHFGACRDGIRLPRKGYTPQSRALRPDLYKNSKILPMGIKPVQERRDPFRDAQRVEQTLQWFAPLCTWEVTP